MPFIFVLVSTLLLYNTTFFRAEEILNAYVAADVIVEARSVQLNKSVLGTGGPAALCNGVPQALAKCANTTPDILITLNSLYTPSLGTILHEVGHGLGLSHSSNKNSLMYYEENGVNTLDKGTLASLQSLGYNVTSTSRKIPYPPVALCLLFGVLHYSLGLTRYLRQ